MTKEQMEQRKEFAEALRQVAKMAESVPSAGWDIPNTYIKDECLRWAAAYAPNIGKAKTKQ